MRRGATDSLPATVLGTSAVAGGPAQRMPGAPAGAAELATQVSPPRWAEAYAGYLGGMEQAARAGAPAPLATTLAALARPAADAILRAANDLSLTMLPPAEMGTMVTALAQGADALSARLPGAARAVTAFRDLEGLSGSVADAPARARALVAAAQVYPGMLHAFCQSVADLSLTLAAADAAQVLAARPPTDWPLALDLTLPRQGDARPLDADDLAALLAAGRARQPALREALARPVVYSPAAEAEALVYDPHSVMSERRQGVTLAALHHLVPRYACPEDQLAALLRLADAIDAAPAEAWKPRALSVAMHPDVLGDVPLCLAPIGALPGMTIGTGELVALVWRTAEALERDGEVEVDTRGSLLRLSVFAHLADCLDGEPPDASGVADADGVAPADDAPGVLHCDIGRSQRLVDALAGWVPEVAPLPASARDVAGELLRDFRRAIDARRGPGRAPTGADLAAWWTAVVEGAAGDDVAIADDVREWLGRAVADAYGFSVPRAG